MGEEPEEQRKCGAEDKAGDNGKVEGGVFAAVDDVAGQAAEFTERVHTQDCSERKGGNEAPRLVKNEARLRGPGQIGVAT